ncbi:peptidylprolyl isomerase [Bacterioplanoides sp.]|uniref:peptidylprolyl isomerase n=1 Tax=Bacterioplanoides sp. TaxID=2066072 RepID=UPI003B00C7BE
MMRSTAKQVLALFTLMSSLLTTQLQAEETKTAATSPASNDDLVAVVIETNRGDIELALNRSKAPISVANFLTYIDAKHYDGTIFHRVIRDFMIQGGGFDENMIQKATLPPIKNEAKNGLLNQRGSIAMARTSSVDSATSQFFINVKSNDFLNHGFRDYGYAVFGQVTKGMDVVDAIATSQTGLRDVPVEAIVVNTIKVLESEKATAK